METPVEVDRRSGISGTEIAAIVGVHPTKTRFSVYAEKLGLVPPIVADERMRMGIRLQPVVVDLFQEETGKKVRWFDKTIRHPKEPLIVGTPDGFVEEPSPEHQGVEDVFEAKTAALDQAWRWGIDGDNVPEEHILQGHWYLMLTERKRVLLAALLGGSMFRRFELVADEDLHAMLFDEAKKFWRDHIQKGVPPEIDASRAAKEYLRERYPTVKDVEVREADEKELELMANIVRLREEEKFLKKQRDVASNKLRLSIGEQRGVAGGDYRALWNVVKGGHVEYERKPSRKLDVRSKRKEAEIGSSGEDDD